MKIKEVFVKCPHCGSDEGYVYGSSGCILYGVVRNEFYTWSCCGTRTTKEKWIEVITKVTDNLEEVIKKAEVRSMSKPDYTREELIELCEKASVQENDWSNRDSAEAQMQIGKCLMLLKAGCEFVIWTEGDEDADTCITDEDTIWINITFRGFAFFEGGKEEKEHFYIPTKKRLEENESADWY